MFTRTTNASSLVGSQRVDLNTNTTATLTSDNVQVNFYYYYDEQVELQEPPKEIEGKVFVSATGDKIVQSECNDTEEKLFNITSIPSGSDAKVGIKEIPRFMVGAITTEYVSPSIVENKINITAEFKMGTQTKTVSYNDLPYRAGYYKITDMAVYKLVDAEVYDAGSEGTIGESLFNWSNGKLKVNPTKMNLNVELTGINNTPIDRTKSQSINNVNNYVSVSIKDKYGNESNSANSKVTTEYLTTDQLNQVDLNSDGKVDSSDKTYANEELKKYEDILKAMQNEQNIAQSTYDNKVNEEATLEGNLAIANKRLKELSDEYEAAKKEKSKLDQAQLNANNELLRLKGELETSNGQLQDLRTTLTNQEKEKIAAENNYNEKEREKERLNDIYQQSITDRNQLAANADCDDNVSEDEYLEQCKLYKEQYQKHLDDKVVENAQKDYEDYLLIVNEALNNKNNTTNAYNKTLNTDIPNKESEISKLNSQISTQEITVKMTEKKYSDYVNGEFKKDEENYESYRDGAYKTAVDNYNKFIDENYETIDGKEVLIALTNLNNAKANTKEAQDNKDAYSRKVQILNEKYDEYKAKYDEFISISGNNKQIAKKLDLKITINVQNMNVKVNNQKLATSDKNMESATYDLYDYMNSNTVPQITTEKLKISKDFYSNIGTTQIKEADYLNVNNIASTKLNGVRTLSGKAVYDAIVAIGEKNANEIIDTVYYSDKNTDADQETTYIFKLNTLRLTKEYKIDTSVDINNSDGTINEEAVNQKYRYVDPVNIYTPITVSSELLPIGNQIVDQTQNSLKSDETSVIQVNVPFKITFDNNKTDGIYKIDSTTKYSKGYYIKFDFDVNNVKINGRRYKNGARIPAGTWIGIITKNKSNRAYIEAQAYSADNANVVTEENNGYTVRAVAYNIPSIMENKVLRFKTLTELENQINEIKANAQANDPDGLLDYVNICTSPTYVAEERKNVIVINRVYDFRVTDVKDISWKSVFRKTGGNSTNAHKGISYYSGVTKWNTESEKSNDIIRRTSSEIGKNPLRTLPIGPYKNTDTTYIKAPKLGYRFSFDMKVTGAYYSMQKGTNGKVTTQVREDKKVQIDTKFYYLSKDGTKYLKESDGSSKGIYLFYKTSDGKYLRISEDNGGGYSIRFTPNDGYRYIEDSDKSTLSTNSLNIGNLRHLTLTSQMATVTNNQAAITYYGEYKLPNSTIAVEVNADGSYDINKPLKDGYIGVVFDIYAYTGDVNINEQSQDVILSYSKNTQAKQNTSQWDYEGFLGYTSYGKPVSDSKPITLKLEKGKWTINNTTYNEIKGTVMLYDIDQRAATDYE